MTVTDCVLHDPGECPDNDWLYTYAASKVVAAVSEIMQCTLSDSDIEVMREEYNNRETNDGLWEVVERSIDRLREDHR